MNEAIIEGYLNVLQDGDPEYMTEGMKEFFAKFDKQMLKRTVDKFHMAFTNGNADIFDDVAKKTVKNIKKIPKYAEVTEFFKGFHEEHPAVKKAAELSKKVIKNTFKIKDKAKLEIISGMIGMTAWVKSKGGKYDTMKMVKTTLHDISSRVSSVYDTGFQDIETTSKEEEKMKEIMISSAKKQEKIEMIVVGVILIVLVSAIVWAGIAIWNFFTSPAALGIAAALVIGTFLFKMLMWGVGIATAIVIPTLIYIKAQGS